MAKLTDTIILGDLIVTGKTHLKDDLTIDEQVTSDFIPDVDNSYDLGSAVKRFANVYATAVIVDGEITSVTSAAANTLTLGNSTNAVAAELISNGNSFQINVDSTLVMNIVDGTTDVDMYRDWRVRGSTPTVYMRPTSDAQTSRITYEDAAGNTHGILQYQADVDEFRYYSTTTTKTWFTFSSTGLTVPDTITAGGNITSSGTGTQQVMVESTDGGLTQFYLRSNTRDWYIKNTEGVNDLIFDIDGTDAFWMDGTNTRFGIGIDPSATLHAKSATAEVRLQDTGVGDAAIATYSFYDNTTSLGYIGYASSGNSELTVFNSQADDIVFYTNSVERFRIDNGSSHIMTGSLGVGDNSYSVGNLSGQGIVISNNDGGSTGRLLLDVEDITSGYNTRIAQSDTGLLFESQSNSRPFIFYTGSVLSEVARIDTAGLDVTGNINVTSGDIFIGGNRVLTVNDEGAGGGIDADTIDGLTSSQFLRSDQDDSMNGTLTATGHVISGSGSGGVAMTINDGYGNANLTFNNTSGVPEQNGNAARIVVNTDDTTDANIDFQVKTNVTGGVATGLTRVMQMRETGLKILDSKILSLGTSDDMEIFHGGTHNFIDLNNGDLYVRDGTTTRFTFNRTTGILDATGGFTVAGTTTSLDTSGLTLAAGDIINHSNNSSRDKIRVWQTSPYAIGMDDSYTYGYLNGYAMTFQMNNDSSRGFWWGDDVHTNAQGAMSLTTDGRLYVDQLIEVNGSVTATSANVSGLLRCNDINTDNGSEMAIYAGESRSVIAGNIGTPETIFLGAEGGVTIYSSPDNWASGWAGRNTATICNSSGDSSLPGDLTVAGDLKPEYIEINRSVGTAWIGQHYRDSTDTADLAVVYDGTYWTFRSEASTTSGNIFMEFKDSYVNFPTVPQVAGNAVWHAGNDGSGSGLDADLLDGNHASAFALLSGATFTGGVNVENTSISGKLFGLKGTGSTDGVYHGFFSGDYYIVNQDNERIVFGTNNTTRGYIENDGSLVWNDRGTSIGGATWNNGWVKIGTSSLGWSIDSNEIYNATDASIGTLSGDLNLNAAVELNVNSDMRINNNVAINNSVQSDRALYVYRNGSSATDTDEFTTYSYMRVTGTPSMTADRSKYGAYIRSTLADSSTTSDSNVAALNGVFGYGSIEAGHSDNVFGVHGLASINGGADSNAANMYGGNFESRLDNAGSSASTMHGVMGRIRTQADSDGSASTGYGVRSFIDHDGTGTLSNVYLYQGSLDIEAAAGTISTLYGMHLNLRDSVDGTITNRRGIWVEAPDTQNSVRNHIQGHTVFGGNSSSFINNDATVCIDDNQTTGTGLLVTGGGLGGPVARFRRDVGGSSEVIIHHSNGDATIAFDAVGTGTGDWSIGLTDADNFIINNASSPSTGTAEFRLDQSVGYLYLRGKEAIRYGDSWLRLNESNSFAGGIYCGTGIFRTDGQLQVGSSGATFYANSTAVHAAVPIRTTGYVRAGEGSGGVSLTHNDGYGNANVCFNHESGVPEQAGNCARIEVNTDSTTGAVMNFEIKSNSGTTALGLTSVMDMFETGLRLRDSKILSLGSSNDMEIFHNGTDNYIDLNVGNLYIRDGTTTRYTFDDNGDFTATGNVTAYSDETLKTITGVLDRPQLIDNLEVFDFDWNCGKGSSIGPMAQAVQRDAPELINKDKNTGILSLDYGKYAVALIYEEKKKREQAEKEINKLRDEVDELKDLVRQLLDNKNSE